ncbi:amino acid permease-domain-containing protein [Biscogniauxia marginata]|nr:amino acid permease-domain-containing protein [Biscogniauxia marginata]
MPPESRGDKVAAGSAPPSKKAKLGAVSGVFVPSVLNIISILMFLRFGSILGHIGLLGMLGLLFVAYLVDLATVLSLSAIASNGEVKGGGAYYLISRSLGPEFGGSIGILFYLSQVLNTSLNVVGLIDCLRLNIDLVPFGYWEGYGMQTCALIVCTALSLAGSGLFVRASNGLLAILVVATLSIPVSAVARSPFKNTHLGVEFTGLGFQTMRSNLFPHTSGLTYRGVDTFRELFGILFSCTSGIFAGASMSGDLRKPSSAIPKGTLWAMITTLILYLLVILSMAGSITHSSFIQHTNIVSTTSIWPPLILAGECATTFFSALMGIIGAAKLLQALGRDKILPGLAILGRGTKRGDVPVPAVFVTYVIAQIALFSNLNQIATLIAMGYQMTFFVMNLACFLLKIGSAPNFRPAFKFFSWHTAFMGSILSAAAMFFIDETYAASAICLLIFLFLLIHYLSPPKHWGDVSQNLIYHQVRKYLLRLRPEHIKFWRPQIILLVNDPRHNTRLIQFCNSMKKGSLYILGHVIITSDFNSGIHEAKLQQSAWTRYITEYSKIKAFVQLTMSPSIEWGVRNLILSAGLGGMRPNIAVLGFYNMDDLRRSHPLIRIPEIPTSPSGVRLPIKEDKTPRRRRGDTSARLLGGFLPTDAIKTEDMMSVTSYLTILEDLALRNRLNVAIGKGFQTLETPRYDGSNTKKYIDLWPIQMSAEITAGDKSVLTTNFDTYTLILQLGYIIHSVPAWREVYGLRVLVFVEYESEVREEQERLKALLEKLRIEAKIHVFWLASGGLPTYDTIVNGRYHDYGSTQFVNDALKDEEWWQDLQQLRSNAREMSRSQELASLEEVLGASRRRGSGPRSGDEHELLGRLSKHDLMDLSKNPTVSAVAKLGGNFGIHTHHLDSAALNDESDMQLDLLSEDDNSLSSSDAEFNDTEGLPGDDAEGPNSFRRSTASIFVNRRLSHGSLIHRPVPSRKPEQVSTEGSKHLPASKSSGYGTMSSTPAPSIHDPRRTKTGDGLTYTVPDTSQGSSTPQPTTPKTPSRPMLSRHTSATRFTSKPTPETRIMAEDGTEPRLMFAEPDNREPPQPPLRSRRNSASQKGEPSDVSVSIPDLLSSYRLGSQADEDARSVFSTQSLPLSFNDLPSRAQHLILNELMRQNSGDAAVLLTTLPIPEEGTCGSEEASLGYLSDIEVLCHGLPPVLLVLSNNMTVTVSL